MAKLETQDMESSLAGIVRLSHHRWLVPLVAAIGQGNGGRFAELRAQLEISGPSLRRVIAAACEADLVMRNPGYGHPLRPEYLLTPWGEGIAQECIAVVEVARAKDWAELMAHKWSLPVLSAIGLGKKHYSDIIRPLPGCSPRSLSIALVELVEAGCVTRILVDGRPPRPAYGVSRRGRKFVQSAVRLSNVMGK